MKNRILLYVIFSFLVSFYIPVAHAAKSEGLDPRAKAVGAMALYGTVSGTMLGVATLAFGSSGRAVAKGASLGLYSGILFGAYIVLSHEMKTNIRNQAPVRDPTERYYEEDEYSQVNRSSNKRMARNNPALFYMNFLNRSF